MPLTEEKKLDFKPAQLAIGLQSHVNPFAVGLDGI